MTSAQPRMRLQCRAPGYRRLLLHLCQDPPPQLPSFTAFLAVQVQHSSPPQYKACSLCTRIHQPANPAQSSAACWLLPVTAWHASVSFVVAQGKCRQAGRSLSGHMLGVSRTSLATKLLALALAGMLLGAEARQSGLGMRGSTGGMLRPSPLGANLALGGVTGTQLPQVLWTCFRAHRSSHGPAPTGHSCLSVIHHIMPHKVQLSSPLQADQAVQCRRACDPTCSIRAAVARCSRSTAACYKSGAMQHTPSLAAAHHHLPSPTPSSNTLNILAMCTCSCCHSGGPVLRSA